MTEPATEPANRTPTDHMMRAVSRDVWIECHLSDPQVAFAPVCDVVPETWVCWREGHVPCLLESEHVRQEIAEYPAVSLVDEPSFEVDHGE